MDELRETVRSLNDLNSTLSEIMRALGVLEPPKPENASRLAEVKPVDTQISLDTEITRRLGESHERAQTIANHIGS